MTAATNEAGDAAIALDTTSALSGAEAGVILALFVLGIMAALAVSWWPLRRASLVVRRLGLGLLALGLFVLPWFVDRERTPLILRGLVTLAGPAVLAPKLLDAHLDVEAWRRRGFLEWLHYLANPYVLVLRAHVFDPVGSRLSSLRHVFGGAVRMVMGAILLIVAFRHDFSGSSFWVEHLVKLLGVYLLIFDGAFVLATGLHLAFAGRSLEFSRAPILARSPADFWRRYNRDAGRFLELDVRRPLVGRRRLVLGIAVVFAANAFLHEYLAWIMIGRVIGFQLLFFAVQGVAVLVTLRWRPRGATAVIGTGLTLLFNIATSALFFSSVDAFMTWYDSR